VTALTTDAVFVVNGESLQIVEVNRSFTRALGYTPKEATQLTLPQLVVADRATLIERLARLATEGEFALGIRAFRRKDGSELEMETRIASLVVDGRAVHCAVARDLTEFLRVSQAGLESEQRYRTLADAALEAIAITEDGKIIDGNARLAELLGEPIADLVGKSALAIVAPEWQAILVDRYRRGIDEPFEHAVMRADGTRVEVESHGKRLQFGERSLRVSAIRDISRRKKLEAQLQQSQRMESIGRLAGGVAHDFNNLLTVILSIVDLLLQSPRSDAEVDDLKQVALAAERAAELTQQLLAFARRRIIEPKVIQVNALIGDLDKMLRRLLGEHIALVTVCARDLGAVRVDPGQIEQVVVNLAVNARDAMEVGGTLTMETSNVELGPGYTALHPEVAPGQYVMIAVSDTGAGMDAATVAKIFEPFFTTKAPHRGSGLGLATCYGIVKQSGGSIWVYSEPGLGTTFKVYLPRVYEELTVIEKQTVAPPQSGRETLLVVEDDEMVRKIAARVLSAHGYQVIAAADPAEALVLCAKYEGGIDALVTDVVLPQMSGKELASRLQVQRPDLRVLYTSGYTENTIVHQGIVDDGVNFLSKPYLSADLARRVRQVLDQ